MTVTFSTGTVTATNGLKAITFSSAYAISINMKAGDLIKIGDGSINALNALDGAPTYTGAQLEVAFDGVTGVGLVYYVIHLPAGWADVIELNEHLVDTIRLLNYAEVTQASLDAAVATLNDMFATAANSAGAAAASATAAATSATASSSSATAAAGSATTAGTQATNAATSATAAATSATNSAISADAASASAGTAAGIVPIVDADRVAAEAAKVAAQTAETNAQTSATNAATSATASSSSASASATSATASAGSATTASNHSSTAATQATAAAASATTASNAAAAMIGTSTSSVAIDVGVKTFTTQADKSFAVGRKVLITSDANPTVNFMTGTVTSYATTTLQVSVEVIGGSGTLADWTIAISGAPGSAGPAVIIATLAEAQAGTDNTKMMTPLRVRDHHTAILTTLAEAQAGVENTKIMTPLRVRDHHTAMLATLAEAQAGVENTKMMTPLRVADVVAGVVESIYLSTDDYPEATLARTAYDLGKYIRVRAGETVFLLCDPTGGDNLEAMANWAMNCVCSPTGTFYVRLKDGTHTVSTRLKLDRPYWVDIRGETTSVMKTITSIYYYDAVAWVATGYWYKGDLVTHTGLQYECLSDHDPTGLSFNSAYILGHWRIVKDLMYRCRIYADALPSNLAVGQPVGIQNPGGDNDAQAAAGGQIITKVHASSSPAWFEFQVISPRGKPVNPTTVGINSSDDQWDWNTPPNRVLIPSAILIAQDSGWDGAAVEGFINAYEGTHVSISNIGIAYSPVATKAGSPWAASTSYAAGAVAVSANMQYLRTSTGTSLSTFELDYLDGEWTEIEDPHDIVMVHGNGSRVYLQDYMVIAGAGDKVLRSYGNGEIIANRSCIGGAHWAREIYQSSGGGGTIQFIRCSVGNAHTSGLTIGAGGTGVFQQGVFCNTPLAIRTIGAGSSFTIYPAILFNHTTALSAEGGDIATASTNRLQRNTLGMKWYAERVIYGDVTFGLGDKANTTNHNALTNNSLYLGGAWLKDPTIGITDPDAVTASTFMKTVLDDTDAVSARTTLGAFAAAGGTMTGTIQVGDNYSTTGLTTGMQLVSHREWRVSGTVTSQLVWNRYYNPNGQVGSISSTTSTTAYSTSSDYRLKFDVTPLVTFEVTEEIFNLLGPALLRMMLLRPISHKWLADSEAPLTHGFIAHEAQAIVPQAVVGEKDAMMAVGTATRTVKYSNEIAKVMKNIPFEQVPPGWSWTQTSEVIDPQGIDTSKMTADIVAAMQELTLMVLDLKAQVAAQQIRITEL